MDMRTARRLVAEDVNRSDWDDPMTENEAVAYARDSVRLASSGPGWIRLDDYDYGDDRRDTVEAYRLVLSDDNQIRRVKTRMIALERCMAATQAVLRDIEDELTEVRAELIEMMKTRQRNHIELS